MNTVASSFRRWLSPQTLLAALLCVIANAATVTAGELRIEALAGGRVDLGGLRSVLAQRDALVVNASGANSVVNLDGLERIAATNFGGDSTLTAAAGGTLRLNSSRIELLGPVTLELTPQGLFDLGDLTLEIGARLTGSGSLPGSLLNRGSVSPGGDGAVGDIAVNGVYLQEAPGAMVIDLLEPGPPAVADRLHVDSSSLVGGALILRAGPLFTPAPGAEFDLIDAVTLDGSFDPVSGITLSTFDRLQPLYLANAVKLLVTDGTAPDTLGPVISNVAIVGVPADGTLPVTNSGAITAMVVDDTGVTRVDFAIDGVSIAVDFAPPYAASFDANPVEDGPHVLTVTARDPLGNATVASFDFTLDLAPPPPPGITTPTDGATTSLPSIGVLGSAEPGSTVQLFVDGSAAPGTVVADASGIFQLAVTIPVGPHDLTATASNRRGSSAPGAAVRVILSDVARDGPDNLQATPSAAGVIELAWDAVEGATRYDVYRGAQTFIDPLSVTRVNATTLPNTFFEDAPPADGVWFYRVLANFDDGGASLPSNEAFATSDREAPRALSIDYEAAGPFDPATDSYGPGNVAVTVTMSEPLLTTPFLTFAASGGQPIAVALSLVAGSEVEYRGVLNISAVNPSGEYFAVFSARDRVDNRGTGVDDGASILVDTQGPGGALVVTPGGPLENAPGNPLTLTLELTLDEPLADGTVPALDFVLSSTGTPLPVALTPAGGEVYGASLTLPATAGAGGAETLSFVYSSVDRLNNVGTLLSGDAQLQVYQGTLPPLPAPAGLTAEALPGGRIALAFEAVADASDYAVLVQAPGDPALVELLRTGGATRFEFDTAVDGSHLVAVASVRSANAMEAVSGPGDAVTVVADSVAPDAPADLGAALQPSGVATGWTAPADVDALRYRLYRGDMDGAFDTLGLRLLVDAIDATNALDAGPDVTEPWYYVTALDAAGNESAPSAPVFLDAELTPVSTLAVTVDEAGQPRISWTHGGSTVAGFEVFSGRGITRRKLHDGLLTDAFFVDGGYDGRARRYTVVAVNDSGAESLERSVYLPAVQVAALGQARLTRGVFNALAYEVLNTGSEPLANARVELTIDGTDYQSAALALPAGASRRFELVVGGKATLPALATAIRRVTITAPTGEVAQIERAEQFDVRAAPRFLTVQTRNLLRGGDGEVRFLFDNVSSVPTDIVLARNALASPSNEVRFSLVDGNGNVLAVAEAKQVFGPLLVDAGNGVTVARIPGGSRFVSQWMPLPVPAAAPDEVVARVAIDRLHYQLGDALTQSIGGPGAAVAGSLVDTAYNAEIDAVSPVASIGDGNITVSGRAIDRISGEPVALSTVRLIFANGQAERRFDVTTGLDGAFAFEYVPVRREAGTVRVSAIHPALNERPEQASFFIGRILVSDARLTLNAPAGSELPLSLGVTTSAGQPASNLRFEYRAEDQFNNVLPDGITLALEPPQSLGGGASTSLTATFSGTEQAAATGTVYLRVSADEVSGPVALLRLEYRLSAAAPELRVSRPLLEAGTVQGAVTAAGLVLSNAGFDSARNVQVALAERGIVPLPPWITLSTPALLGDLAVGAEAALSVSFQPPANAIDAVYEFELRISADNQVDLVVPGRLSVTQSGEGGVLFKLSDLFTATRDSTGALIPGLEGATVQLQNEAVGTVREMEVTDALGEALFEGLPSGRYAWRASAPKHKSAAGTLVIEPGRVRTEDVFLDYRLVSISWSVREIAILDVYEIVLNARFETDVPGAVVVLEPASVQIPEMAVGESLYGELTLTNYGLVRADNLDVDLPSGNEFFSFEFFAEIPDTLAASQRLVIPYRVTKIRSLDADASGGGCGDATSCVRAAWSFICANGEESDDQTAACFIGDRGEECQGGPGGRLIARALGATGGEAPDTSGDGDEIECDCPGDEPTCEFCKKPRCIRTSKQWRCVPDPGKNGARCGDQNNPSEACKVCKDGSCAPPPNHCMASGANERTEVNLVPGALSSALSALTGASKRIGDLTKGLPASVSVGISPSGSVIAFREKGEKCCPDCQDLTPARYEKTGGQVKGTLGFSVTASQGPSFNTGFYKSAYVSAASLKVSATASATFELSGTYQSESDDCPGPDCETVSVQAGGGVGASAKAEATAGIFNCDGVDFIARYDAAANCQLSAGVVLTGELAIKTGVSATVSSSQAADGSNACGGKSCTVGFNGVTASGTLVGKYNVGYASQTYTETVSTSLASGSSTSCVDLLP